MEYVESKLGMSSDGSAGAPGWELKAAKDRLRVVIDPTSRWTPGRKLVLVVVAAVVGAMGWAIAKVELGPESMCKGAKCATRAVELESDQWSLLDQRKRSISIRFEEGGGCHRFKKSEVEEPLGEVRVTMVVEVLVPGEGEACTEELKLRTVEVELDRDLRDRELRVFRREVRVAR